MDDAKHKSEDKDELFHIEGVATKHSIEKEKNSKSKIDIKFTTKCDEIDVVENRVDNDNEVFKKYKTNIEEKISL